MASPQKEKGYTPIANELLENFYQTRFSSRELKIILAISRFTYGFSRKDASLSLTFLAQATKLSVRHVQTTIKKLLSKNILIITNAHRGIHSRKIQLNKNYDSWNLRVDQKSNTNNCFVLTNPVITCDTASINSSIAQSGQPRKQSVKQTIKQTVTSSNCFALIPVPNALSEIPGFNEIWFDWIQYRKEIKKPLTPTAVKRQFNKLINFKNKGHDIIKIIDNSISRRWQDFFEPNNINYSYRNNGNKEIHLDDY